MNWTRVGIVASVVLCVWIAWPKGDDATPPRPLLIRSALKQVDDPVVILGDSIVRRTSYPKTVCGRTIVNAGIDGSTTASGLDAMLTKAIGAKQAAMIVVSLGLNDAGASFSAATYKANYQALLTTLKSLSPQLAVTTVTPVEAAKSTTAATANIVIESYNSLLSAIAGDAGAKLIVIPEMPASYSTDGVHLNQAGYAVWTKSIIEGISNTICKGR